MKLRALRTRLAAWAAALAIAVAVAVAATFYAETRETLIESLDESLETRAAAIAAVVRAAPAQRVSAESPLLRPYSGAGPTQGFEVRSAADLAVILHSNSDGSEHPFSDAELAGLVSEHQARRSGRARLAGLRPLGARGTVRAFAEVFRGGEGSSDPSPREGIVVVVHEDFAEVAADLDEMLAELAVVSSLGALMAIAGAWVLARRIAGPIESITAAAEKVGVGGVGQRVPTTGAGDEIDRLAGVVNAAFDRVESAYARQAQFTADASHELRTPVSIVLSRCEVALLRPRTAQEYRETIEASFAAATRMADLIDGLLLLARSDAGIPSVRRSRVDVAEVARSVAAEFAGMPGSADHPVQVRTTGADFAIDGDPGLLAVLLRNLLDNAVVHSGRPGEISVEVRERPDGVDVVVRDDGAGIAPDHLPHVTERFYRGDPSRSRETGGCGLGLAIVLRIARLHGGDVLVQSEPGRGCTVTATLRRAGASHGAA